MIEVVNKTADQRIVHYTHTWEKFKLIQKDLEGSPGVRLFYYNGTIEILMPGEDHEFFKTIIGFLIELFLVEKGIEFIPAGSMTQEQEGEVSVQADEFYWVGEKKRVPDLSIEVIFAKSEEAPLLHGGVSLTSGGSNKLERYQALGVSEVWFWEDGLFTLYHLREQRYEQIYRSELSVLTALDINLLAQCVLIAQTSRVEAVKEFRKGT